MLPDICFDFRHSRKLRCYSYTLQRSETAHVHVHGDFESIRQRSNRVMFRDADVAMSCSSSFMGRWLYGELGCNFYGLLNYYCGCISLNSYAAIAILRFSIIVKRQVVSKMDVMKLVGAVHGYTFILTIPPLFGWNGFVLEAFYTQCDIAYKVKTPLYVSYIYVMFIGLFFVPLIIIGCSYYRVIRYVVDNETRFKQNYPNSNSSFKSQRRRSSVNLTSSSRTSVIISVCSGMFVLAWSPYCVIVLWALFGNPDHISQTVSAIPALLAKSSSVINPWIFVGFSSDFRKALKEYLLCGRCCNRISESVFLNDAACGKDKSKHIFMSRDHQTQYYPETKV